LVERVAAPLGGGWAWQVLLGGIAVTLLGRLLVLPWDAWSESVRRRYGLSTRGWGTWFVDVGKSYGVGLVLTLLVLFLVVGLARWSPEWWWTLGAALGALLVVAVSFAYPVVVEPVFNKFEPMPSGELRSSLLALARDDGVQVDEVLVADASRRTSSLNAYVSGFGSTRRIVVYDTLLDSASNREIELIVAHELGHAKRQDVVWGTLLGALGVALLVCLLALVTRSGSVLSRAGVPALGDGRSVALVLAVVAVLGFVSGPGQALVSRRVETRADVHALELTRDPESMIAMQRRLSTRNISDLDPSPVVFGLFFTHPTAPQRIALARTWARANGLPVPPPSVPSPAGQ
jgi:STE24 endopeptidase